MGGLPPVIEVPVVPAQMVSVLVATLLLNPMSFASVAVKVLGVVPVPQLLLGVTETIPLSEPTVTEMLFDPWPELIIQPDGTVHA